MAVKGTRTSTPCFPPTLSQSFSFPFLLPLSTSLPDVIRVSSTLPSHGPHSVVDRALLLSPFSGPIKLLGVTPPVSTDPPKPAEIHATKGLMEELVRQKTFESKDEGRLRCVQAARWAKGGEGGRVELASSSSLTCWSLDGAQVALPRRTSRPAPFQNAIECFVCVARLEQDGSPRFPLELELTQPTLPLPTLSPSLQREAARIYPLARQAVCIQGIAI